MLFASDIDCLQMIDETPVEDDPNGTEQHTNGAPKEKDGQEAPSAVVSSSGEKGKSQTWITDGEWMKGDRESAGIVLISFLVCVGWCLMAACDARVSLEEGLMGAAATVAFTASMLFGLALRLQREDLQVQRDQLDAQLEELKDTREEMKLHREETKRLADESEGQTYDQARERLANDVRRFVADWTALRAFMISARFTLERYLSGSNAGKGSGRYKVNDLIGRRALTTRLPSADTVAIQKAIEDGSGRSPGPVLPVELLIQAGQASIALGGDQADGMMPALARIDEIATVFRLLPHLTAMVDGECLLGEQLYLCITGERTLIRQWVETLERLRDAEPGDLPLERWRPTQEYVVAAIAAKAAHDVLRRREEERHEEQPV